MQGLWQEGATRLWLSHGGEGNRATSSLAGAVCGQAGGSLCPEAWQMAEGSIKPARFKGGGEPGSGRRTGTA